MIAFYRFLGIIADLALIIYAILLWGLFNAIPVTLTLPGIAGMILTIGVAADANVVIFERIKEEMRNGRTVRSAINTGYSRGIQDHPRRQRSDPAHGSGACSCSRPRSPRASRSR